MNIDTSNEVSPSRQATGLRRIAGVPAPLFVLVVGVAAFFALHPLDGAVSDALDGLKVTGDVRREWEALQQFGQGTSIVIVSLVVFLLDRAPARRARLLDFGLALAMVGVVVTGMKWFVGRPRPKFGDPGTFLFPWGTYPLPGADGTIVQTHAWNLGAPSHAQLWSMPSSHTAFAVVMAVFLGVMYPRLRWLAGVLALVVAGGRLVFDAHWLTDVVAGGTVALAVGWPVVSARVVSKRVKMADGK